MQELTLDEVSQVSGGVVPAIAWGAVACTGLVGGAIVVGAFCIWYAVTH